MANLWSRNSELQRRTCHRDLQVTFDIVLQRHDCSWVYGRRGELIQNKLFTDGVSQVKYPNSKHNTSPLSMAADIIPVIPSLGRITGNKKTEFKYFYAFSGIVKSTMMELYEERKIQHLLRWGGDWDNDMDFDDQNFNDLYHWECMDPQKYLTQSGLELLRETPSLTLADNTIGDDDDDVMEQFS